MIPSSFDRALIISEIMAGIQNGMIEEQLRQPTNAGFSLELITHTHYEHNKQH